jgi:uncharacterized protein (DUF362 family)
VAANRRGEVFLVKTADRNFGVKTLMSHFDLSSFSGKKVALKANFNSADPFPASTHLDTLGAVVEALQAAKVAGVTLGVGVRSASEIPVTALNEECKECAEQVRGVLEREG